MTYADIKNTGAKILVLGGSSFVGRHLVRRLGPDVCVATHLNHPAGESVFFDACTMELEPLLLQYGPFSHCVILLGDTQPDSCFHGPQKSELVNVTSIKRIIDTLERHYVFPIFTSSEFVFDGTQGEYTENDPPSPILLYGRQKMAMEEYLADRCQVYTIFRLAKIYGDLFGDNTLFTSWLAQIADGERSFRCAADQRFSPVLVHDVVEAIYYACHHNLHGVYHLAGPQPFPRLELLQMLIDCVAPFVEGTFSITPCSIDDFDLPEPRPKDVSMRPDRLVSATSLSLTHPATACIRIVKDFFSQTSS